MQLFENTQMKLFSHDVINRAENMLLQERYLN